MQSKTIYINSYPLVNWKVNKLHKLISARGSHQQEICFLFGALYGDKAVTRSTRGRWKHMDREIKKRERAERRIYAN